MSSESPSPRIWLLRNTAMFEDQSESLLESAELRARQVSFERGDVLSFAEDAGHLLFVLVAGQVKLRSFTEGGKEIILDVAGPGDAFGAIDRVVLEPHHEHPGSPGFMPSEAVALSKGSALGYEVDYFVELLRRRPAMVVNISRILGLRQKRLEVRLSRLLYRSSLGKVAGLLAELGERYGTRGPSGTIQLSIKLTHQEMASIVGVKRETVSEALADLEYRGIIRSTRAAIEIEKPEELDKIL